jgi:hypothetical protein
MLWNHFMHPYLARAFQWYQECNTWEVWWFGRSHCDKTKTNEIKWKQNKQPSSIVG